ncbi:MAG: aromatic acid exporter family protein [Terrisporobacter othiniensis]|uniref:FUSC family protein n=1 Tax=Terrisporobacter TaxID=1505652 RepID=UPI001A8E897D|nr:MULTISPECIES: aromatic acid exporter family protein [Terrisporobacter]MBN9648202.1 FUSC family protein [Terrisporobacter glycolicus]MDU4861495.1 aromatic acid exporter family protein [Terrisporobacter othiniensis]MDU6995114.1 aromatic acid exporter family protein [Terrisporobacter othiniensis]
MKLQKPGMRNIKTGIGVMICALIGKMNVIDSTFYAAIACVVSMQTTVKSSLTVGLNRLKGTFIGGLIGFLFVLIHPGDPIISCLGIITTIYICNILKINKSITIACVVYCAINLNIGDANPIVYSLSRILDTSIGVIVGVAVNYFIYRPNYLESIYKEIRIIEKTSIKLLKSEIEKGEHADISSLKSEITRLEGLYKNFLEELEYSSEDIENKEITNTIKRCKQIYLHLQVLEQMKDKCYLNKENYIKSKSIYDTLPKGIEIKDNTSTVYNYHISSIIDRINEIHEIEEINDDNESDL